MCPLRIPPLPSDTAHAAETTFGRKHLYLKIGREIAAVLADFELPAPLLEDSPLASAFWPLSLASILQYWEDLTDQQMVDAARTRLDLKYALHLSLNFPGFEARSLCLFRQGLKFNDAGRETFQKLIWRLKDFADSPAKAQVEAEQIINTLCLLSRAEIIVESMGMAIEAVAARCPNWLLSNAMPHWIKYYYDKPGPQQLPRDVQKIEQLLKTIGNDAQHLLVTLNKTNALNCKDLPEIQVLRRITTEQFDQVGRDLLWRSGGCTCCARAKETQQLL